VRALLASVLVVSVAGAGCGKCRKTTNATPLFVSNERHLAVTGCSFAWAMPLMDATIVRYDRMRFGIATPDGLDTSIEAGFIEAAGERDGAEEVFRMSGRLDDLWVVVRSVPLGSETDHTPYERLVHRKRGKWSAIPSIHPFARYRPPILYRGGAFGDVLVPDDPRGTRRVGFDLPPDVDLEHLFPGDAGTPVALETGEIVAPAIDCIYVVGADGQRRRVALPQSQTGDEAGPVPMSGVSRATFRVFPRGDAYRLDGNELVLDASWDAGTSSQFFVNHSTVIAFDGERFEGEERRVYRGRRPAEAFECTRDVDAGATAR
jgi:hypothetical protein